MPFSCLFVRVGDVKYFCIRPGAGHDLQADWQIVFCESTGDGDGWQTRQIEWGGEACKSCGLFDCIVTIYSRRGDRGGGQDQNIMGLKEHFASLPDLGLGAPCESIFCRSGFRAIL